jgi:uncharacterized membrane protein YkvI
MARKRQNNVAAVLIIFIAAIVLLVSGLLTEEFAIPAWISLIIILAAAISLAVYFAKRIHDKFRAIQIANVDVMTGIDFKRYLRADAIISAQ